MMIKPRMKTKTSGRQWLARGNGRISLRLALACVLAACSLTAIDAHEQRTAVTQILFNQRTGNIEVMHRFLVHDAEHAASMIFGSSQNLLESPESRELFSSYVINRFAITARIASGEQIALDLEYLGQEIDGQFLWVYQEISDPHSITALTIINLTLRDIWPDQANLVNIDHDGQLLSLSFTEAVDELTVEL